MSEQILRIAGYTDTGRVREHNEDCIAVRPDLGLAVLADGMGGHRAGEVASRLAVQAVVEEFERALAESPLASGLEDDGTEVVYLTLNTISQANALVYKSAQNNADYTGMGTTMVLALFTPDTVTIAHVGDSRAYRLRDARLERLTQDHSMVEEAVRKGIFSAEAARRNFSKNIITRALGVGPDIDTDVQQLTAGSDDLYLLCSDGLSDLVCDSDLQLALLEFGANLDEAAQHLIGLANKGGGRDNISVVLARYQTAPRALSGSG